ncbi:MAG: hypothetical protein LBV29_09680 [Azoarcus sp.]|jgi:tetratricopeptide (TPR) repeat protein|nr:hypothetical protein [Azoarcus sp.]
MITVLSSNCLHSVFAATRLIAVTVLLFIAGFAPSHAQPFSRADATPALDTRDIPAQTLFNQAVSMEQESLEKAVPMYEQVMQRYGRASSPGSRQFAARALLNKAGLLGEQGNLRDAITTYERIERNFGNERSPTIREVLASAIVSKAEAFYKQDNADKTLATYAQLEQQFASDENEFIKRLIDITKWRVAEIRLNNPETALSSR